MKRRDFFGKSGCGLLGVMLAHFGLTSCKKEEETAAEAQAETPAQGAPMEEMSRKDMVKKMLIEKMDKTEEEADAMIAEFEEKLPMVKEMCICKNCPSYVGTGEGGVLFCGVGKSSKITEERGCSCGLCPVVGHMGLTRLYYCTRGNEREQRGISI